MNIDGASNLCATCGTCEMCTTCSLGTICKKKWLDNCTSMCKQCNCGACLNHDKKSNLPVYHCEFCYNTFMKGKTEYANCPNCVNPLIEITFGVADKLLLKKKTVAEEHIAKIKVTQMEITAQLVNLEEDLQRRIKALNAFDKEVKSKIKNKER